VSKIDSSRKWTHTNGLIIVGLEQADKTILNAIIHDIDINPGDALSLTAQRLLDTPEVHSSIQRAELNELTPELGFGQIRNPAAPSTQSSIEQPKHLHEITLLNALNLVAATKGTGVWEYEQYTCNNKSSFRLSWIVK
jgi:hypothetical protein